jgi:NAD(P)-dependent dehydrogenase (short-subunit alcohol dehydrogenase family)
MNFSGKKVLVTGATRGIGRATTAAFLKAGATVAVNGRKPDGVDRLIDDLGGKNMVAAPGDLSKVGVCENVAKAAVDGLGGLDYLVNNAGLYVVASMEESDEAAWDRLNDINVKATFFLSRAVLPALRAAKGAIVNLGSSAGLAGSAQTTIYCATKGAVVNLTRAMAQELAPDIRVNCVCPAVIATEMGEQNLEIFGQPGATIDDLKAWYPLKRVGTAEEVAQAILFLCSPAAAFMTGSMLAMDGGALSNDSG